MREVPAVDKFVIWKAVAVPLDQPNIDTNQLCPTRFNKTAKGPGFARVLFHDLRFHPDGSERPDFILNEPRYRMAGIIVADRNFGCGSSRESAVYALSEFGIRSIIAPSFGGIFYNNCLKNGVVPVVLDEGTCAAIRAQLHAHPAAEITVDLERQLVIEVEGGEHTFALHPVRRRCLIEGRDDMSLTAEFLDIIHQFELDYRREFPWLRSGELGKSIETTGHGPR
jgi:3-isopropylmalate/(R)-2-methylmalate dehydratase small subunit